MVHHDAECAVCGRVVPAEEVEDQRCEGCGGLICDEHTGEPRGVHDPEDHVSAEDAEESEDESDRIPL
jgi:hypothetical protein